jgi:hypothetical protein
MIKVKILPAISEGCTKNRQKDGEQASKPPVNYEQILLIKAQKALEI